VPLPSRASKRPACCLWTSAYRGKNAACAHILRSACLARFPHALCRMRYCRSALPGRPTAYPYLHTWAGLTPVRSVTWYASATPRLAARPGVSGTRQRSLVRVLTFIWVRSCAYEAHLDAAAFRSGHTPPWNSIPQQGLPVTTGEPLEGRHQHYRERSAISNTPRASSVDSGALVQRYMATCVYAFQANDSFQQAVARFKSSSAFIALARHINLPSRTPRAAAARWWLSGGHGWRLSGQACANTC